MLCMVVVVCDGGGYVCGVVVVYDSVCEVVVVYGGE